MEQFRKLGIAEGILNIIKKKGFKKPSEVQEKAIPLVLAGKDVIAGAATGSGKTLAFGAGVIQKSERGQGIQSLVLTPTRELAEQVSKELKHFSEDKRLEVLAVYGGVSINPQIHILQRADVVVGTPGRILDHLQRKTINLSKVKVLVLDEADRMVDMGFIEDVEKIISQCSKERQTLMFSATISKEISRIKHKYMKDPETVDVEQYVDPKKLKQVYYDVQDNLKFSLLVKLLQEERSGLVMVFCNTRHSVDFVAKSLSLNGVDAHAIHGGFTQAKRSKALERFNSGKVCVLVCTDVASRGLDIKGVSHVYNFDIPKESKQYIHRIGRTARAGEEGIAVNLLGSRDHENYDRVLRDNDVDIKKEETPMVEKVKVFSDKHQGSFGQRRFSRGGSRPSNNQRRSSSGPRRQYHSS